MLDRGARGSKDPYRIRGSGGSSVYPIASRYEYESSLFSRKGGVAGWLAMPFYIIFEWLGPIIEVSGYLFTIIGVYMGIITVEAMWAFFVVAMGFGVFLSISTFLIGRDRVSYLSESSGISSFLHLCYYREPGIPSAEFSLEACGASYVGSLEIKARLGKDEEKGHVAGRGGVSRLPAILRRDIYIAVK